MRVTGSCGPQADLPCSRKKRGRESETRERQCTRQPCDWVPVLAPSQHVATVKCPCPGERGDEARRRGLGTNVMVRVRHTPGTSEGSMVLLPLLDPECVVKERPARSPHPSQRRLMPSWGCWTGREGEQWAWVRRICTHHPLPNTGFRTEKRLCS